MFYWLAAIPFFIALMMLAVVKLPEHGELKNAEDMQTEASVFRMANQHDAAVRYIEALYKASNSITSGTAITQNNISGYLPSNYVADYDLVKSYVICTVSNCSLDADNSSISILTILDPVKGVTYLDTDKSKDFIRILGNYKASFPMRKVSGEGNNYKGFTNKQSTTFAGRIINKTANNGFMMEQKEGDNYVLPNEVYNFKIGEVNALGVGEPAIITVIGKKPKPQVCTDTKTIDNTRWFNNGVASKCSDCSNSQVQQRNANANYPYDSSGSCFIIPTKGSSESWSNRGSVSHNVKSITCNEQQETYHLIGGYVTWWEAVEICDKLGLNMPTANTSLTNTTDCGSTRWSLLKSAFSVTGEKRVWTKGGTANTSVSPGINLYDGSASNYVRNYIYFSRTYALCGPKI